MSKFRIVAVAGALMMAASAGALAQYKWIDAKGTRHYSDTPPPAGAAVKIVAAPGAMQQMLKAQEAPAQAAQAAQAGSTLAEREAEFRKRRTASAEASAKAAEAATVRKQNTETCAIAQQAKARYESGNRIRSEQSENMREPMGDAERTAALAKAEAVLADCRKAGF